MATDRNGNPIAVGDTVNIMVRPMRVLQVEPHTVNVDEQTETLFVYPDYDSQEAADAAREYLSGVVRDFADYAGAPSHVLVKVQGIEAPQRIACNRVEVTA